MRRPRWGGFLKDLRYIFRDCGSHGVIQCGLVGCVVGSLPLERVLRLSSGSCSELKVRALGLQPSTCSIGFGGSCQ